MAYIIYIAFFSISVDVLFIDLAIAYVFEPYMTGLRFEE